MKHVISFVLALCLLIPFGTGALAADAGWAVDYYVDDFGDTTDYAYLRSEASGDFSSAETASSPLTVVVSYDWGSMAFYFRLLGDSGLPVTYTDDEAEDAVFKIKTADGVISEGALTGEEPNGELYLDYDLPVAARMMDALREEEDVRCIVELGGAKYNFTVDGGGFPDCLAELQEIKCAPRYTEAEALLAAGDYDGAIAIFQGLWDYKDSADRAAEAAEAKKAAAYADAEALLAAEDYDGAIAAFETLGDYEDAADRAVEAEAAKIEAAGAAAYADAEKLLADGDKLSAAKAFGAIRDYSDAWERCFDLWGEITSRDTIVTGTRHTACLRTDGTVVAVGDDTHGQSEVGDWTDIVALASEAVHTVGLRSDGTVVAAGNNDYGQCEVSDWTDIVAIAAGNVHTVGLKSDGTVVATGDNEHFQCNVSNWKDIVALSGSFHTVGLCADGTVVAVGDNYSGQCEVDDWTDIVAVSAGWAHTVGLRSDGTVAAVGNNDYGQCNVSGWRDIVAVSAGYKCTVGVRSDGTVVAAGSNDYGQSEVSDWTDIVAVSAGYSNTVGLRADGTVAATKIIEGQYDDQQEDYDPYAKDYGQCDVSDWTDIKLPDRENR